MTIATPLGFGIAATAATLAGGALALRLAGRLPVILAVTAGVVLGVALFDLFPEAVALATQGEGAGAGGLLPVFGHAAIGLAGYMVFERALAQVRAGAGWRHHLAPATLSTHSFLDGLGIGLAFQLSPQIGDAVALAVLTHDVADGVNVVSLCLASGRRRAARGWLAVNGAAPLLGVLAGSALHVAPAQMAPLLGIFAGGFLYIGACELLPRARERDPRIRTAAATAGGLALIYLAAALSR